jgi:hypothetical protein
MYIQRPERIELTRGNSFPPEEGTRGHEGNWIQTPVDVYVKTQTRAMRATPGYGGGGFSQADEGTKSPHTWTSKLESILHEADEGIGDPLSLCIAMVATLSILIPILTRRSHKCWSICSAAVLSGGEMA